MLIGPEWLLPAARALKWLSDFGRNDLHEVKQEISGLLNELWATHRADMELRSQIMSVRDEELKDRFPALRKHWQDAFFDSEDFRRTRTHCGEIRRRVESVKFQFVRIGRADLGKWKQIDNEFSQLMNADDFLTRGFNERLASAKKRVDEVFRLYSSSREEGLADFKRLKAEVETEEGENKGLLNEMERTFKAISKKLH